ncbi:Panacea domain-containing protein [Corynebacterium sp.]|uniref:Panacea domain-containing protein n=1 Tax=Corynebacterium sp. TaxID=1720 RepID=UPI0026DB7350|nr:Panacea domain-containing protein [Corynebacterium sp.]MDO5031295.1 Panacea domain-containing protein [Corynebacterium sp.]
MAKILDVAQFITESTPNVDKMRLYKLCFFAQGWHLAWAGSPLVTESFEAWRKGPVPPTVRNATEGTARGWSIPFVPGGDSAELTTFEKEVIESVVEFYAAKTSTELSRLSHGQAWSLARQGLPEAARGNEEISVLALREEFTSYLKSSNSLPTPPAPACVFSFEDAIAAAALVEEDWSETFNILATK